MEAMVEQWLNVPNMQPHCSVIVLAQPLMRWKLGFQAYSKSSNNKKDDAHWQ
jgi:hypothetical protein